MYLVLHDLSFVLAWLLFFFPISRYFIVDLLYLFDYCFSFQYQGTSLLIFCASLIIVFLLNFKVLHYWSFLLVWLLFLNVLYYWYFVLVWLLLLFSISIYFIIDILYLFDYRFSLQYQGTFLLIFCTSLVIVFLFNIKVLHYWSFVLVSLLFLFSLSRYFFIDLLY